MRIGMYSPYVPKHFGGGEKHFFDVALALAKKHQVFIGIPSDNNQLGDKTTAHIRDQYAQFLNRSLKRLHFVACPFGTAAFSLNKIFWTRQFDVFYAVTDGSLFFSLAKQNHLHIQIPFTHSMTGIQNKLKLANWHCKNTNSYFTRSIIEKKWQTKIQTVLQPMVATDQLHVKSGDFSLKDKVILNVGRFFRQLHCKRQDVLVRAFARLLQLHPELSNDWKLVLIGSVEDKSYARQVVQLAKDLPITILHDVTRSELTSWYKRSALYWHATGYEIDEDIHPEKVEHFGISTVEAMAAGCAPVVINKGGQREILTNGLQPYLWNSLEESVEITARLIADHNQLQHVQLMAQERAQQFNQAHFEQQVLAMVE
jgi:glycosyltransferase involved in cell wall biosynthesis